jgi:uncharacterized protein with von Willebrand factor type A (vWA) domain
VEYPLLLNHQTVVILVSDTKTLELDAAVEQLVRIKRVVKDIIWLNTLPQGEWADIPSVKIFQRQCRMHECYTLAHLELIIRKHFLD